MPGAHLYANTMSYARSTTSTTAVGFNASPAPEDGMDADVIGRIGYLEQAFNAGGRWIPGTTQHAGTNKGRMQGICCGITTAWLAGFLNNNPMATDHAQFRDYLVEVLRFQGAYGKDYGDTADDQRQLLLRICQNTLNLAHREAIVTPHNMAVSIPFHRLDAFGTWGAYLHAHGHATGFGSRRFGKTYIMDANGGLFEYTNRHDFTQDLKDYLRDIRNDTHSRTPQGPPQGRAIFYHRAR